MKQRTTSAKNLVKPHKLRGGKRVIPDGLMAEFADFVEYHPAREFSITLRKMLLEFLMRERAVESVYLKDLLYHIDGLFDLLDAIDREVTDGRRAEKHDLN